MKKILLFINLVIAAGLAGPRPLCAESGIVFGPSSGTMTGQLNMGGYAIISSSDITAARYQIAGTTVLAVLPGTGSLGVGVNAGSKNTGSFNSFLGAGAGYNTTGSNNSFFGADAGYANTTGWGNSFVGRQVGQNNDTGYSNSFLGMYAGFSNTAGYSNSLVGYGAGYYNQTGSANTILGYQAGYGVFTGSFSNSTLVGYQAGYELYGSDNTLLGWRAGYAVTTGTGNIVIGYNKGTSAPAASNELNIGGVLYGNLAAKTIGISTRVPQAALDIVSTGTAANIYAQIWRDGSGAIVSSMTSTGVLYPQSVPAGDNLGNHTATAVLQLGVYGVNTSSNITAARYQINGSTMVAILPGADSIAYGVYAGTSNITGNYNVFIGNYAGTSNRTGNYNTANGYMALFSNTTAGFNTANGYQALYSNTGGGDNTANGYRALYLNTTGNSNAANGSEALYSNTTGGFNTANGERALRSNTTGGYNTANGHMALRYNQTGSANSVFGVQAGHGVGSNSFSSSTLMGYRAGYNLSTGSDNTFLGWQAGYDAATGSGNIVIGYGKNISDPGASNELNIGGVIYGDLAAKTIGISTRVPQAALDVVSTGTAANVYAQIWRDGSGAIVSSMTSTGVLYPQSAPAGDNLGNHTATLALNMSNKAVDNVSSATITGTGVTGSNPLFKVAGSTMVVLNNGNVGIGTAGPTAQLHVVGVSSFTDKVYIPENKLYVSSGAVGQVLKKNAGGWLEWGYVGVPTGTITFFDLPGCPSGWTEVTGAQGRYLLALPSGGTLAGTAGTALTDLESRPVGQHAHGITDAGHYHNLINYGDADSGAGSKIALQKSGTTVNGFLADTKTTNITVNNEGAVAGTNAPYIQYRACKCIDSAACSSASGGGGSTQLAVNLAGGAAGAVVYQSGESNTTFLNIGANNTVLTSNGSVPAWNNAPALSGANFTGVPDGALSANVALLTGAQTFTGAKTFSAAATFPGSGIWNASGNVGIGTTGPGSALDINGALSTRGMSAPSVAPSGQGRIYFDSAANKFKISENNGAYVNLAGDSTNTAARAYRSGGQTFPSAVWTKVQFNAEDYDIGNNFDSTTNYRYTVPVAGRYLVTAGVCTNIPGPGGAFYGALYVNGAIKAYAEVGTNGSGGSAFPVSDIINLSANDYIEAYVTQASGSDKTLCSGSQYVYLAVHRLGDVGGSGGGGSLGGSGAANYISKWTDGTTLGNSTLYESGGNVGIGTTAPGSRFEVVGGSATFRGSDSNSAIAGFTDAAGNYRMVISTSGNVGIGTTGPGAKLSVNGNISVPIGNMFQFGEDANWGIKRNDSAPTVNIDFVGHGAEPTNKWRFWDNNTGTAKMVIQMGSGNVGIGTTGPGAKLHAVETSGTNSYIFVASTATDSGSYKVVVSTTGNVGIGTLLPYNGSSSAKLDVRGRLFVTDPGDIPTGMYISRSGGPTADWNSPGGTWGVYRYGSAQSDRFCLGVVGVNEPFCILTGGNVGIGTTGPGYKLDVNGDTNLAAGSVYRIGGVAQSGSSKWTAGTGDDIYRNLGNVGIGTTNPQGKLAIEFPNDGFNGYDPIMKLSAWQDGTDNSGNGGAIDFYINSQTSNFPSSRIIHTMSSGSGGELSFATTENYTTTLPARRLVIKGNGNVGIGTASPQQSLHVAGSGLLVTGVASAAAASSVALDWFSGGARLISRGADVSTRGTLDLHIQASNGALGLSPINVQNDGDVVLAQSGGNVGIGTTNPTVKLHILDSAGATARIETGAGAVGASLAFARSGTDRKYLGMDQFDNLSFTQGDGSNDSAANRMFLQFLNNTGHTYFGGNVGIGTTGPGSRFEVVGGSSTFRGSDSNPAIAGFTDAGGNYRLVISTAGNVGIGTTGPAYKMEIVESSLGAKNQLFLSQNNGPGGVHGWKIGSSGSTGDLDITRYASSVGTTAMTILGNGNVGIGTTGPGGKLDVNGAVIFRGYLNMGGNYIEETAYVGGSTNLTLYPDDDGAGSGYIDLNVMNAGDTAWMNAVRVIKGGNVGIGTTVPDQKLTVAGNISQTGALISSGTGNNYFAGNVGIGTTGPVDKLQVVGAILTSGAMAVPTANSIALSQETGYSRVMAFGPDVSTKGNWRMYVASSNGAIQTLSMSGDAAGNVGIGTTVPGAKLHAVETSGSSSYIFVASTATDSGSYKMVVSTSGNVGIGTTDLGTNAHNAGLTIRQKADDDYQLFLSQNNQGTGEGYLLRSDMTDGDLTFSRGTAGTITERVRFTAGGNVGIGTANPTQKLYVKGSGAQYIVLEGTGDTDILSRYTNGTYDMYSGLLGASAGPGKWGVYNNGAPRMVIDTAGNVGIGTTAPGAKLTIRGVAPTATDWLRIENTAGFYRNIYMGGGDDVYFASADETPSISTTGQWVGGSDIAYKKDIKDMSKYGLETVMLLKPREYIMKADLTPQIGFIAQEMETIVPEVVSGQEGHKGISYGQITPILVKAMQEQQKYMENQQKEIESLKLKVMKLEKKD